MTKLKVGVAFNNVVADIAGLYASIAEHSCGQTIYWTNFINVERSIERGWLTAEEYEKIKRLSWLEEYKYRLKPMPKVQSWLSLFAEEFLFFIIIPHTGEELKEFLIFDEWLRRNRLNFIPRIGICSEDEIGPLLEGLGADVYVSADLDELDGLIGKAGLECIYLSPWSYTEGHELPSGILCVERKFNLSLWRQIYDAICRIRSAQKEKVLA